VDRLVELRNQLDDIFEEISTEFEATQNENDNLRRSLEVVPKQRAQAAAAAEAERLQRILDQLQGELQQARSRESQAAQQLQQLGAQNRESIGVLEDFKRETERLKAANSELQDRIRDLSARQLPPGVTPEEVQRIRAELERERRKSVGLEDDARRRLQDY
jgi:chromosome segregation ATPase